MLLPISLLCVGFFLLFFGGNMLIDGAVRVARRLGVSNLLIGLVLVGFGTSMPEFLTNVMAVVKGSTDLAVGNVVGSNIANVLLVFAIMIIINPVSVQIIQFKKNAFFLVLSCLLVLGCGIFGIINFYMGLILTLLLLGYVWYMYKTDTGGEGAELEEFISKNKDTSLVKPFFKSFAGLLVTLAGAKLLVDNAVILAEMLHISQDVIGLTVVAVGTSLPELAVSILAAVKKQNDVAFGNILGSNIFNLLFVLGVPALIRPLPISAQLLNDIFIMMVITFVLIGIAFWRKSFSRATGVVFLFAYALYIFYLF
ncbi:MAG: calcium/sodium antiporter [Lactobacillales bacterium]|jgi:cation:H+ antiporter|nr:calcium/sodium antiporter [Lactobacillales bacterium]